MFVGHCLRSQRDPPPVTLLAPTREAYEYWNTSTRTLALLPKAGINSIHQAVDVQLARSPLRRHGRIITPEELMAPPEWKPHYDAKSPGTYDPHEPPVPDYRITEPIHHLILNCQPQHAISNLLAVRHRLSSESTILFATPGLGIMEEVSRQVFIDPATRPYYLAAYSNHHVQNPDVGKYSRNTHQIELLHAYEGTFYITPQPLCNPRILDKLTNPPSDAALPPSAKYLLDKLSTADRLGTTSIQSLDLHLMTLQRTAIDSVIKPLSALADAPHSSGLFNYHSTKVQRLLLAEISLVMRSLPEVKGHPLSETKFGAANLETMVVKSLWRRFNDVNVTLMDVRKGRKPDLDYFNGYVVRRGEEMGLRCFLNYAFWQMVMAKQAMVQKESADTIAYHGLE